MIVGPFARLWVAGASLTTILLWPATAVVAEAVPAPSVRSAEMPELSGPGTLAVGTELHEVASPGRTFDVRLWYPAIASGGATRVSYRHTLAQPGVAPLTITEQGRAFEAVPAVRGQTFPLIVMSHGYGGWAEQMSQLGETLASRGYVVAAIDHRDLPVHDLASFMASFGSVLINRSADQRTALALLLAGKVGAPRVAALIDQDRIGLLGYSMGGYGALTTAGARLDPDAPAFRQLPVGVRDTLVAPDPATAARIKAVVALAPWGAQPGSAVWTDAGLAALKAPLLIIDGDRDDVVDFERGVRRIFEQAKGSDRRLLVFREAAHNIAGNPVNLPVGASFAAIEFTHDPVWRKERIEAIDEHFIVAFLDSTLKDDATATRYLDVPTETSRAGEWPTTFGKDWGGTLAGDEQPKYWRGFQRRWAAGLELHYKPAGQ